LQGAAAHNHRASASRLFRNLALAWVLTLPMAMILSGLLFVIFRQIF
jgi:phosphate/sulfate permease